MLRSLIFISILVLPLLALSKARADSYPDDFGRADTSPYRPGYVHPKPKQPSTVPYVIAPGYKEGDGEAWGVVEKVFINGQEMAGVEHELLYDGSQIKTGAGVEILVRSSSGAVVRVKENTRYEVKMRTIASTSMKEVYGRLIKGVCEFYWPKGQAGARKFEVETNRVVAGIKGTSFTVAHDGSTSIVTVQEGVVEVTNLATGAVSQVSAGNSLTVGDSPSVQKGKIKTSSSYTVNCEGDLFQGGHWAGSHGGSDWIQKDFETPQLITKIFIGEASTDITTKGFKLILKLKKIDGTWITIDQLHDTNINRSELSGGATGDSIPSYSKSLSPAIEATAFRLEFHGHGWFDATDIRIYAEDSAANHKPSLTDINDQNGSSVPGHQIINAPVKRNSGKPIQAGNGVRRNSGKPVSQHQGSDSLTLIKEIFEPDEKIELAFTASPLYPSSSWIGMFKVGEPHAGMAKANNHELSFKHLRNKPAGSFTFTAPAEAGSYDFRMFEKSNGKEVAIIKFNVTEK